MTTSLILESDCPWKTAIVDERGCTVYDVKTAFHEDSNYTAIRNERYEIIATLRWRDLLPDQIMFGEVAEFVSLNTWLKRNKMPMAHNVKWKDNLGRGYIWQGNAPGLPLQLFSEDDKRTPIVIYHPSALKTNSRPTIRTPPRLELSRRGQEIRDMVVISFVCLEKKRRTELNKIQF